MWVERILVEDVEVGKRLRPTNEQTVVALAKSMHRLGQLTPISVYRRGGGTLRLVAGSHRLEAAKRLGWIEIDAVFSTGNELERELQEIAENLHRCELTTLERDTQIGRWADLTTAKVGQVDPPAGGAQPAEKGVRKVARGLNLERKDVERAVKVASISPEAKQAARDAGLDDNRKALLAVAKESTPDAQVARVRAISSAKDVPSKSEPDTVTSVKADPIGALKKLAEFCRATLPRSFEPGILPVQVAELRSSIAIIDKWLSRFARALDDVGAADVAAKAAKTKQALDIAPPAKHEISLVRPDPWSDLDIPSFLDRRGLADASKSRTEAPRSKTKNDPHYGRDATSRST
jgi:ParB family chromosome partitioning protein